MQGRFCVGCHTQTCNYGSCAFDGKQHQIPLFIHVDVTVSIPATASFSEDARTVQVCATLTGMSAVPVSVTVSATDGKSQDGSQKLNGIIDLGQSHTLRFAIYIILAYELASLACHLK